MASKLKVNRRDIGREPMPELGYSLGLWNGDDIGFSASVGAYNPYIGNSVVLSLDESVILGRDIYRKLLEEMIGAFDPEHGVVTSRDHLARAGVNKPWDAGWFTYKRGGEVQEHPMLET